jgi:hypothetical protein
MPDVRRPIAIYFIAAWCFVGLTFQISAFTHFLRTEFTEDRLPKALLYAVFGLLLLMAVWHTVCLVQLRLLSRWFAGAFLAWWTVLLVWNTCSMWHTTDRPWPRVPIGLLFAALSLVSADYLARPRFREEVARFLAEREKAGAAAEKSVVDEIET